MSQHIDLAEDESDNYWNQISKEDQQYLVGPKNWPNPCPWCGGRLQHSSDCVQMQAPWAPTMPFGKYKGKSVGEVPVSYLNWVTRKQAGDDAFRKELKLWQKRKGK